jgi:hypothetical protein
VRFLTQGGTNITIMFPGVYGIDPSSSNIEYRGMTVGSVTGVDLSKRETRSRSARALSTAPPKFSERNHLLAARRQSQPGRPFLVRRGPFRADHRDGTGRRKIRHPFCRSDTQAGRTPPGSGVPVLFVVAFEGEVGGLTPGDPVRLRGFSVGEVKTHRVSLQ